MKRFAISVVKVALSASILGYLFQQAWRDESFSTLVDQPKDWGLLSLALVAALISLLLTIVRWRLLVQTLRIPFTLRDAMRLGMLGYLFNFFTLGIVGGDVLKAIMIARKNRGRQIEAVASVMIDRIIGLYALVLVASLASLWIDWSALEVRNPGQLAAVRRVCSATVTGTIVGGLGLMMIMTPTILQWRTFRALGRLPLIGPVFAQIVLAIRIYQERRGTLVVTLLMSIAVHLLSSVSVYLVARGLPGDDPSLGTHFVIVPLALVAGAIPLPGGLGAVEYALDYLYRGVATISIGERHGFLVALTYRVITMLLASIGFIYYLHDRREVRSVIAESDIEIKPEASEALSVESNAV